MMEQNSLTCFKTQQFLDAKCCNYCFSLVNCNLSFFSTCINQSIHLENSVVLSF